MTTIAALRQRQDELVIENRAILAQADNDKRELNADERKQVDANSAEFEKLADDVRRRERVDAQAAALDEPAGRQTEPEPIQARGGFNGGGDDDDDDPDRTTIGRVARAAGNGNGSGVYAAADRAGPGRSGGGRPYRVEPQARPSGHGSWGFRHLGEFAGAVRLASVNGGRFDQRLDNSIRAAATTYGQEGVGEQGGFLVPPDMRQALLERAFGEESLIARTDQMFSSSNTFVYPIDETTPWQSTGGVQAYWTNEAGVKTPSRPLIDQGSLRLNKLTALIPVTDELLDDAPGLDGYLRRKAPAKIDFKVSLAIVQGTGVGQPYGILNSPALITVAKDSGQVADTITFGNIVSMWARMAPASRSRAVWIANADVEPQLMRMVMPGGTQPVPIYMPPGGLSASPYATLLGRPLLPTEAANVVGDVGDLILADLSQYLTVRRTNGIRIDTSIHLYFDQDITAFRFVLRIGGAPWWGAPIDRRDGSNTLSAFVAIAARA